jgi:hypothetical protein
MKKDMNMNIHKIHYICLRVHVHYHVLQHDHEPKHEHEDDK